MANAGSIYNQDRPCSPVWVPTTEPWAHYYKQLYPGYLRPRNSWHAYKYATTAREVTQTLWAARKRARRWWESSQQGVFRELKHVPVVLWFPECAHSACLSCTWIDESLAGIPEAFEVARSHSITHGDRLAIVEAFEVRVFDQYGVYRQ